MPELVVYRPLEALLVPAPWYKRHVLLIGDAAHAFTPHVAQGAAMAVEDAVVLGDEIGRTGTLESALERFSARRTERVKAIAESSIQLGEWEQRPVPTVNTMEIYKTVMQRIAEPI